MPVISAGARARHSGFAGTLLVAFAALLFGPGAAVAQDASQAYYRAASGFFGVDVAEVSILAEYDLSPDEIMTVLYIAQRAGVPTDAVAALHRGGRGWFAIARRFAVGAEAFHTDLPESATGALAGAREAFVTTPRPQWSGITLEDRAVVALVNLRVVRGVLDVPAERVLDEVGRSGSFAAAFGALVRR